MRPIKSNKKSKLALKLALYLQVLPHATLAEESSILTGASVVQDEELTTALGTDNLIDGNFKSRQETKSDVTSNEDKQFTIQLSKSYKIVTAFVQNFVQGWNQ